MPEPRFDQFERRLIRLVIVGVGVWTLIMTVAYFVGNYEPSTSDAVGFALLMVLATSLFFCIVMFIPLSNTHERLKREYGDSYDSLLRESGKAAPFNGLWEAKARLTGIERQLKNSSTSTSV